jgi:hypothetical protein
MNKRKLITIVLVGLVILVGLWVYINRFLTKSKASVDKVNITYSSTKITVDKNGNFNLGVILNAENNKKISAVDLSFKYDSDDRDLVDFTGVQTLPANYFDQEILVATSSAMGAKNLHLVLAAKKTDDLLSSSLTINLAFKAKNTDGQTEISLMGGGNQVVGTTENYSFDLIEPTTPVGVVVGESGNLTQAPTIPPGEGNVPIAFQLRFQGIIEKPVNTSMPVKITIKKGGQVVDERTIDFSYDQAASGEAKGRWLGSANFNVLPGDGYTIFVKGPKHVQKKICESTPQEAAGAEGTYHCLSGQSLSISPASAFDFSHITLLAGDLPEQDGVVNSYDTSLVRNNLGKTDTEALQQADVNFDGRINTQDYSLIIYALSIRTDEE